MPQIVFEEAVGPVPVSIARAIDGSVIRCTLTTAQPPCLIETIDDRSSVAAMLEVADSAVLAAAEVWSCGVPFLVVPLADVDALSAATLDSKQWHALLAQRSTQKVYPVARAGDRTWRVRMFAPGFGVAEDPATGSAAAALAGWLAARHSGDGTQRWDLLQGQEIGRPSSIALEYEQTGAAARTCPRRRARR